MHNPHHPNVVVWGAGKRSKKRVNYIEELGIKINYFMDVDKRKIGHNNVISYKNIPVKGQIFIVSYVNNRGMRAEIKSFLISMNYSEGVDYIIA